MLLGIAELEGVVAVERQLFAWEETDIHLDTIAGLGEFVELEAEVGNSAGPRLAQARFATLRGALGVSKESVTCETYG